MSTTRTVDQIKADLDQNAIDMEAVQAKQKELLAEFAAAAADFKVGDKITVTGYRSKHPWQVTAVRARLVWSKPEVVYVAAILKNDGTPGKRTDTFVGRDGISLYTGAAA